jgi:hypothetical protein
MSGPSSYASIQATAIKTQNWKMLHAARVRNGITERLIGTGGVGQSLLASHFIGRYPMDNITKRAIAAFSSTIRLFIS